MHSASQRPAVKPVVTRLINNVSFPPKHQSKTWYVLASNVFITSYIHRALHLQFFSSLCTIINSIEGPRKHPTNWAPQLLRPALSVTHYNNRMNQLILIIRSWGNANYSLITIYGCHCCSHQNEATNSFSLSDKLLP